MRYRASVKGHKLYLLVQMKLMKMAVANVMITGRPRLPTYGAMMMRKMSRNIKF